nr:unnamed protein product [Callosobruchus analis]
MKRSKLHAKTVSCTIYMTYIVMYRVFHPILRQFGSNTIYTKVFFQLKLTNND